MKSKSMFIFHLIFLIIYYWPLKTMGKQQPITMVTLGRPFRLGMLYDIRTDKIITGVTLWDQQNLTNYTSTHKQPYTGYETIVEDSLQKKAHALGVDASLKLSLLSGLISTSGSAKYAEDYQKTNHEIRLTLKYSTTTHFEQLTINHSELHGANLATHVVTGVVYGAEAFFVFDRTILDGESEQEIRDSLIEIFDDPMLKIEGNANLNLTDQEKNVVDKLRCKFYGDFHLSDNPNTFAKAVRIYRQLPSMLGKNYENAVPTKVWLHPLSLLDNQAMPIVRDISSNLVDYTISVIEKLHSLEVTALDLSKSPIFTHLNYMKKHLLDFTARLSELQRDLKEKIALYLPKLRGNTGIEESALFDLFKQVESSSFNRQKLESWLEEKEKEIALITKWIENLTKDKNLNITIKSSSLTEVIGDIDYDYIFCLSLRLVEENDSQLIDMYNDRYDEIKFNSSDSRSEHTPWFEDRRILAKIRKNLRQFIEFAKANNVQNRKMKFIVNEEYSVDHAKSIEHMVYANGLEKTDFIIPSKPGAPYAKNVTYNSITLGWTDAASGSEKVSKYKVMYRQYNGKTLDGKNEDEEKKNWTEVYTNANSKKIIILNLPSKTTFVFKVQSITAIGRSTISGLSKPTETLTQKKQKGGKLASFSFFIIGLDSKHPSISPFFFPKSLLKLMPKETI